MPTTLTDFKLLYFYILKVKQRTVYVKFHILQSRFTITLILQIRKLRPFSDTKVSALSYITVIT